MIFNEQILNVLQSFRFSNTSKINWTTSKEKTVCGVGGLNSSEPVPSAPVGIHLPQSKLHVDVPMVVLDISKLGIIGKFDGGKKSPEV